MFNFFMVLLCVIIKSVWYAGNFEYSCMRCSCTTENKRHCDFKKLRKRLLTIKTRNTIRWNIYRDNNCYSRRQVLRVKCFWTWRSYKNRCRYKSAFRCLLVFQDELEARISLKAFLFYNQYSSERFLSIWGQKMSKGFWSSVYQSWNDTRSDHCLKP